MDSQVRVSGIFDAPVKDVWKVWSDAEYVKQWWGPDFFTCPVAKMDFREGGVSLVAMQYPKEMGGQISYSIWAYTKIIPMKSIEFVQNLSDENGMKQKPVSLGMPPDFPEDVRTVVTFKELDAEKTEVTVIEYADFGQIAKFAKLGLEQSIEKARQIFSQ